MSKPEELVPTLETCKRLKAAGFEQDTLLGWHTFDGQIITRPWFGGSSPDIAAPTLQEILPHLHMLNAFERSEICQGYTMTSLGEYMDVTPAEAAALLWLELHEVTT